MRKRISSGLVASLVVLVAFAVGITATAGAAPAGHDKAQPLSGKRHHKKPKEKEGPRGKRGPKGDTGAAGAAGPAGAAGAPGPPGTGIPFSFTLKTNAPTAPVFYLNGWPLIIEAGCINGVLELVARPEGADHNIVEVTSFDNSEGGVSRGVSVPEAAINAPINMLVGGSGVHDYNGLLALHTYFGQMVTVQWWAMGSINASQGDCVGGGTVSI